MTPAAAQRADGDAASRRALALAAAPEAQRFAHWAATAATEVDWPWVLRRAEAHKVGPLLAARAADGGLEGAFDPSLRRRLALLRLEAAARAGAAMQTLARVADALTAARLPFFVVKGSVLAYQVYGAPQLRRFADVDLVVRAADVAGTEAVLARLGYRPGSGAGILAARRVVAAERALAQTLTRRFAARRLAAFDWDAPHPAQLPIDLHWQLAPTRLRVAEDDLWAQTVPVDLDGTTVPTLTPAATVVHLAIHAATCLLNGFRLLHLADVAWAAGRYAEHAASTWRLAERWRVADYLALVLAMAERVFECEPLLPGGPPPRPLWRRRAELATVLPLLLDAPLLTERSPAARARRELLWSVATRNLRRNVAVTGAAALVRARFRYARWRLPR